MSAILMIIWLTRRRVASQFQSSRQLLSIDADAVIAVGVGVSDAFLFLAYIVYNLCNNMK